MGEDILKELLTDARRGRDPVLERLEDVEKLTGIIHAYRKDNERSREIAMAIIRYVKEGRI